jgi:hypothetical protein
MKVPPDLSPLIGEISLERGEDGGEDSAEMRQVLVLTAKSGGGQGNFFLNLFPEGR